MNIDSQPPFFQASVPRTDAELVAACRSGEAQAFVEIVERHQSLVCAVAYSVTGRLAISEEVAQDTFVTAWRKMTELREPARLRGWLSRIAHARAVDCMRQQRPGVSVEALADHPAPGLAPDAAAASEEEAALVWKALETLPEATRLPLVLFYREGRSITAVAEALDLSEDAVKQRLSRGRTALRDRLADLAESVLGRTRPSTVFTFAVLAAVGALAAPAALAAAAMAGTAGAAGASAVATATVATPSSSTATTTLFAAMTAPKTTAAAAAAITLACLPVGWSVRAHRNPPVTPDRNAVAAAPSSSTATTVPSLAASALHAEWLRLHDVHGRTKEAMPALLSAISDIKDTFRRRAFRAALIAEWVSLDADGALRHFRQTNNWELSDQTMREWMLIDPRAAVEALLTSGADWESVARPLLGEVARLVPGLVPTVVAQLPAPPQGNVDPSVKEAFSLLATRDLASARAEAESLTGPHRDQAMAGVAAAWAARDPEAALAWSQSLPEDAIRHEVVRALLLGWVDKEPVAALDHIDLAPPGGDMTGMSSDLAATMLAVAAEKDFGATMRWLSENPGRIGNQSMNGLMQVLSDKLLADTAGTLAFLQKEAPLGMGFVLGNALLNQGYERAAEIRDWLTAQEPGPFVDATRMALINATAWNEPMAVVDWVREMPESLRTPDMLKETALRLLNGGNDFSHIDELIAAAPADLRSSLISAGFQSGGEWPGKDVTPWLGRLEEVPPDERAQASAVLAGRWVATDPEAAVAWASALPDEDIRRQAYAAMAGRWAQADSYEASQWIASLPAGAERDAATRTLVTTIAPSEPDSAWRWAQHVSEPGLRTESMAAALAAFAKSNPSAGREALSQATGLADETRSYLQSVIDPLPPRESPQPATSTPVPTSR